MWLHHRQEHSRPWFSLLESVLKTTAVSSSVNQEKTDPSDTLTKSRTSSLPSNAKGASIGTSMRYRSSWKRRSDRRQAGSRPSSSTHSSGLRLSRSLIPWELLAQTWCSTFKAEVRNEWSLKSSSVARSLTVRDWSRWSRSFSTSISLHSSTIQSKGRTSRWPSSRRFWESTWSSRDLTWPPKIWEWCQPPQRPRFQSNMHAEYLQVSPSSTLPSTGRASGGSTQARI